MQKPVRRFLPSLLLLLVCVLTGCSSGTPAVVVSFTYPSTALVRHFALSARQGLRDLNGDFSVGRTGADTGILLMAGEKVEVFAAGTAHVQPGVQASGPAGTGVCNRATMPQPALACYSVVYSIGISGTAGEVGTHLDMTSASTGNLFLGINSPNLASNSGAFQMTVLIVPPGTIGGVWATPSNNFRVQGISMLVSAYIYGQDVSNLAVDFTFSAAGNAALVPLCHGVPGDAEDLYLCYWNFNRQNGLLVSNGTYDIGFTVTGQKDNGVSVTPDVNPDSVRAGQVIYAQPQISDNYAGYAAANAADPTPYQQVTATWQIPSATCSPDAAASSPENTSDAAIWVGLTPEDAANPGSKTPIYQLGTDSICFQGVPQYDAWWEIYPAPSYNISPTNALFNVQSGDIATATVTYQQNTGTFILSIQVRTSTASNALSIVNWSSTPQLGASIGATMAECIVESPADATTNKLIPLAEFGKVSVDCQVNNNKPIASGPQNYLFQMQTDGGAPKATVSPLASDGSTFTVTWNHG